MKLSIIVLFDAFSTLFFNHTIRPNVKESRCIHFYITYLYCQQSSGSNQWDKQKYNHQQNINHELNLK